MNRRETSAEIDADAADWAVRVDEAPLDPQAQAALDAWLAGDSRRLGAYARFRAALVQARRVRALGPDFDAEAYAAGNNADVPVDVVGDGVIVPIEAGSSVSEAVDSSPSRRRVLVWGGSAVAASLVGIVGLTWPAAAQTYRTEKGEVRLVPLEDGSSITLNTASEVQVRYVSDRRQVTLVAGEALFDVARDPARPFVVDAGETEVRAIGTSFTVRRLVATPVEVMVRQGVVEVSQSADPSRPPQRVTANVRAVATPQADLVSTPLPPAQVGRELAWREGMLSFEDMTLRDAAAEFARYSDVRIEFANPALANETVTGLYAANNPRGFARSVALSLNLNASNERNSVTLSR
jgi:transmembrane sensor